MIELLVLDVLQAHKRIFKDSSISNKSLNYIAAIQNYTKVSQFNHVSYISFYSFAPLYLLFQVVHLIVEQVRSHSNHLHASHYLLFWKIDPCSAYGSFSPSFSWQLNYCEIHFYSCSRKNWLWPYQFQFYREIYHWQFSVFDFLSLKNFLNCPLSFGRFFQLYWLISQPCFH